MAKALSITWQVKIINKKKFAKLALHKNIKAFVIYIICLTFKILIYLT